MSTFNFRDLKKDTADEWFRSKNFVKQPDGSWQKPRRVVPRVRAAAVAVAESNPEHAPVQSPQREAIYPDRVRICITSYCCGTQRDTDNIFVKHSLDCCRYAGLISSDCPGTVELVVKEIRVLTKKEEGYEVVITPL